MCNKHLLGEHGEIHKHRHNFIKKHSIAGRLFPVVQIEPLNMRSRHDELSQEMVKRGFNHQSPYEQPSLDYLSNYERDAKVDLDISKRDLSSRCIECAQGMRVELTEYQRVKLEGRC
jgi:hypothetical protein